MHTFPTAVWEIILDITLFGTFRFRLLNNLMKNCNIIVRSFLTLTNQMLLLGRHKYCSNIQNNNPNQINLFQKTLQFWNKNSIIVSPYTPFHLRENSMYVQNIYVYVPTFSPCTFLSFMQTIIIQIKQISSELTGIQINSSHITYPICKYHFFI